MKKSNLVILASCLMALAGCGHETEEQYKARIDKEDEAECISRGFGSNPQALEICKGLLLREREKREMRDVKDEMDSIQRLRRESRDRLF